MKMEHKEELKAIDESNIENIEIQPKWKSKYFWTGIFSIVAFILGNYGLYDAIGLTAESFQTLVNLILGLLAGLGVFNNSSFKNKW